MDSIAWGMQSRTLQCRIDSRKSWSKCECSWPGWRYAIAWYAIFDSNHEFMNKNQWNSLHSTDAAIVGQLKLVKMLVERGADPNFKNRKGKTPCDVAASAVYNFLITSRGEQLHLHILFSLNCRWCNGSIWPSECFIYEWMCHGNRLRRGKCEHFRRNFWHIFHLWVEATFCVCAMPLCVIIVHSQFNLKFS